MTINVETTWGSRRGCWCADRDRFVPAGSTGNPIEKLPAAMVVPRVRRGAGAWQRKVGLLVTAVAAAAAISACGGGGAPAPSRDQFIGEVRSVCASYRAQVKHLPQPLDISEQVSEGHQVIALYKTAIDSYSKITPSVDEATAYHMFVDNLRNVLGGTETRLNQAKAALSKGDTYSAKLALTEDQSAPDPVVQSVSDFFNSVGLQECNQ